MNRTEITLLHTGPLDVNTYLVNVFENRVLVVDPADCSFCGDCGKVYSFLQKNKLSPLAILLTHGHFDHVAGLPFLKEKYPHTPILIHADDAAYLGENSAAAHERILYAMGFDEFLPSVTNLPKADAFLQNGKTLEESLSPFIADSNDKNKVLTSRSKWRIIHTPGHTPGSVCLYNKEEEILLSGDTLFHGSWGRTDLAGGNENQMQQSLALLEDLCGNTVLLYAGH